MFSSELTFDAVVVGAGHAGIEATRALSAQGVKTALITLDKFKIGAMSCNPAIGGVAKGHLVFEVDAMGGLMGMAADQTGIQSRRLNLTKGPAVRSTRVQCDKDKYSSLMSFTVSSLPNVTIIEDEAAEIIYSASGDKVAGVRLRSGVQLECRAVIISAGTFMRGLMFCGDERSQGGRYGDRASDFLTKSILEVGHQVKRLKTGTPARLNASTVSWDKLEKQWGDPEQRKFSWRDSSFKLPQLCCYLTYTNERTHDIIRKNFHRSPLFSGDIVGVGPRYCPSVEDKIKRFPDRDRHQIFLEPEGLDTLSIYPNGLSTSLPADVQLDFLRSISGLESVELLLPGYAVEYDTINPTELKPSFMSKFAEGLFCAGQVNRTSGYEEAAAQGLWAGVNAGLFCKDKETLRPNRSRSYMETLVDDLVSVGTDEPYRMFTSRSEYRLLLREDNAAERLFELAKSIGLLSDEQAFLFGKRMIELAEGERVLSSEKIRIDKDRVISLFEYLRRPEVTWESFDLSGGVVFDDRVLERLEIKAKYSGYLVKQEAELKQLEAFRSFELDSSKDIGGCQSLSSEVIEKYNAMRPKTVGELFFISGITPSAVLTIARFAGRKSFCMESVSRETPTSF